ncbi:hypothetical protein ACFMQL_20385 [Nonomuraea fastidiosa]|uniref:hypothetical protein n=1 Tax=Nonomuraea fastidiosa TaxID=46173 RepID=UPI00367201B2
MDQDRKAAARTAAEATEKARKAMDNHHAECPTCIARKPCSRRTDLQRAVYNASQASHRALLAYAPTGSTVEYHGPAVHQHGVWTVQEATRSSLYTRLLLSRADGAIIDDVPLSDIRRPIEPEPTGTLAAVRTATSQLTRLLSSCGFLLHVRVAEVDGRVMVQYDGPQFSRYERQAHYARQHATGQAAEDAAYVVRALDSLRNMSALARTGMLDEIRAVERTAAVTQRLREARPTRRPTA